MNNQWASLADFKIIFNQRGGPPKPDEAKIALKELRTLQGKIQSEHQ